MKIRIKGNSVRIRLTRSEVTEFGNTGLLEERTEFGNHSFEYSLVNSLNTQELSARFDGGKITVLVPDAIAKAWTTTDTVGYENNMDIGGGKSLFVLIEKDFKCIDNTTEDQSDHYDHPTGSCG